MDSGLKLKRVREKLGLRFREVEQASQLISQKHRNADYTVGLSRLADIENKGVIPNIHRLYSLCAIYRLDLYDVLDWYGLRFSDIWRDARRVQPGKTHLIGFGNGNRGTASMPIQLEPGVDFRKTTYLSRVIQQWGKVPLGLLDTLDIEDYRYAFIGAEDHFMEPLLRPGAMVQIDEARREIQSSGWDSEFDRPIYFFEMRDGYACSWCSLAGDHLILQPHPSSPCQPLVLNYPADVDVIGQVVGVAMQLAVFGGRRATRKKARSAAGPK